MSATESVDASILDLSNVLLADQSPGGLDPDVRVFRFWRSPEDLRDNVNPQPTFPPGTEWRPCSEEREIPGDDGPNRVAYWLHGDPVVMVYEGPDEGMWIMDSALRFTYWTEDRSIATSIWLWSCKRLWAKDPCDEEYMREISS